MARLNAESFLRRTCPPFEGGLCHRRYSLRRRPRIVVMCQAYNHMVYAPLRYCAEGLAQRGEKEAVLDK